ncbi:MAG: hypothetical protein RL235_48 [Chlamydiota bacterium]|jgi:cell shape-determining protein MreC
MNRTAKAAPILFLVLALFAWISVPKEGADSIRKRVVSALSPVWSWGMGLRHYLNDRPIGSYPMTEGSTVSVLALENQELKAKLKQAAELIEWYAASQQISESKKAYVLQWLQKRRLALPAKVLYRDPSLWGSSLWIQGGQMDSEHFEEPVFAKNSPVLCNDALVGVIDIVGKRQSRVRLITDSAIFPSVCVLQGDQVIARGELHGSSKPLWRSRGTELKGIGFRLVDRPFRDGMIRPGDLLVTSGLDGVFPPHLPVATVTHVEPLEEGAYSYELLANPIASRMNALEVVYVLPPESM